jgi:CRISPR-associated exonuclease Cas4
LCGQALCLEEMFHQEVPLGAVFHAASRRRREVRFTPELRDRTCEAVLAVRRLLTGRRLPAAVLKPQCEGCSLRPDCLPELNGPLVVRASKAIFENS